MRILFTGASSFTGFWFVRELARSGHELVATFRRPLDAYTDAVRRERVALLAPLCHPMLGVEFGDDRFLALLKEGAGFDLLCHHAADVREYKSPAFDIVRALASNTRNVAEVTEALAASGCRRIVLTGSVFENDEGAGSEGLPAFSPYGLSKGLTAQVFRYHASRCQLHLGKFVIPNPFGPYEDPRFTAYLVRTWRAGKLATVNTPSYVRDNIHVSLLAKAYAHFASTLAHDPGASKLNPSGYCETQGAFAERFAGEMRSRLGLACALGFQTQTRFEEPRVRINTDILDAEALGWNESAAWDDLARYYRETST
jgi:nucleoside-diphosphate-sugar epimerase